MSVTFWAPDAPCTKVQPYEAEPDYWEEQSELPEINVSCLNANRMLRLMGLYTEDLTGSVEPGPEMTALQQRLLVLVNDEDARAPGTAPAYHEPGQRAISVAEADGSLRTVRPGRPDVYAMGTPDHMLKLRLQQLQQLVAKAQQAGYRVCWG